MSPKRSTSAGGERLLKQRRLKSDGDGDGEEAVVAQPLLPPSAVAAEDDEDGEVCEDSAEDPEEDEGEVSWEDESSAASLPDDGSSDDSQDDAPRNRIGNVPLSWYADEEHVGYDIAGEKVVRTLSTSEIDSLLDSKDNPDAWRTIKDHKNQREVKLTDTDLEIIRRIRSRMMPSAQTDKSPMVVFDNPDAKIHTMSSAHPPKSRFLPSKWERMKIKKLVALLREGKIRPPKPPEPEAWDLWADDAPKRRKGPIPLPAPKMPLPGHAESYNPPEEYLWTEEEKKEWEENVDPEKLGHIPQKIDCLRRVPAYKELITERFMRCLDLYLVPRALKQKMNVDPESLLPKLPNPKDLRPFPTHVAVSYDGHDGMVRSLSVHASGEWLATASSDNTVRIWEVASGRCFRVIKFDSTATALAWNPNHLLLTVAADEMLFFVDPGIDLTSTHFLQLSSTGESQDIDEPDLLKLLKVQEKTVAEEEGKDETAALTRTVMWKEVAKEDPLYATGCRLKIACDGDVQQLTWHVKGSYCAAVSPKSKAPGNQCIIHSLNSQKSMRPFTKLKGGSVQACAFHPSKPHFFVATKTGVRIFDLQKQSALKQLVSGAKWISSLTMHPSGDHVVCGSYDRRIVWFDMDFGTKPYKTLQYHDKAVRRVAFHQGEQPLMASCSDDATISVMHTKVYSDLMKCPLVVPVKRLREHAVHQGLGVLDCQWHPVQPWLFTAGADHRVFMWA